MIAPANGWYCKIPGTLTVALSWIAESMVPEDTFAGFAHVITGVTLTITTALTVIDTVLVIGS